MYWWNTHKLAEAIKNDVLNEYDKMKYFLTLSLILVVSMYLIQFQESSSVTALIEMILMFLIVLFGILITFKANRGNEGKDYIVRVTCLSLPILIKIMLLSVLFGIIIGFWSEITDSSMDTMYWILTPVTIILQILFYVRLTVHLKYINS